MEGCQQDLAAARVAHLPEDLPPSATPRPASLAPRPLISAERRERLLALLERLGLDPRAPGGPISRSANQRVDPGSVAGPRGAVRTGGGAAGSGSAHARDAGAAAFASGRVPAAGVVPDPLAPLEIALTHSSAGRPYHHEQLEFLGDAVLRLAASEMLERCHPSLSVGQRSTLRSQLVSDRWLADLAEALDLAPLLHLGAAALGDASGRATVLAECCEALVGAVYQAWGGTRGGLEAVLHWLTPAWQRTTAELLADPDRHNWKTALQEWSQGNGLGLPRYTVEEISRRHGDPQRFQAVVVLGRPADRAAQASLEPEGRQGALGGSDSRGPQRGSQPKRRPGAQPSPQEFPPPAGDRSAVAAANPEERPPGGGSAAGRRRREAVVPSADLDAQADPGVPGSGSQGRGGSRREAEQQAARAALAAIKRSRGSAAAG